MRILADQNIAAVESWFGALGPVQRFDGRQLTAGDLTETELLLVRSVTRVDAALLAQSPVRFVGSATSGVDHLDRDWLAQRGIACAWAPGCNADAVVDYVLSAIAATDHYLEALLAGARLGIVGFGAVGQRLAARMAALGVNYCAFDPWLAASDYPQLTTLEAVLACPVVSIHAALTPARPWPSYRLLGAAQLAALPQPALLINTSRGELFDRQALQQHASHRPDLQLVLDVWEGEPAITPALLRRCRFGSAHIAGYSSDAKIRATRQLARACHAALGGSAPPGESEPAAVAVTVPTALSAAALLRFLLAQVYDIAADDSALRRAVLGATASSASASFDRLRRQYRQRRELNVLRIDNAAALSPAARALATALGCRLDDGGSTG